jgi:hypothetical protein
MFIKNCSLYRQNQDLGGFGNLPQPVNVKVLYITVNQNIRLQQFQQRIPGYSVAEKDFKAKLLEIIRDP